MAKKDSKSRSSGMGSGISSSGGLGSGVDVGSISSPKDAGLGSGIDGGGFSDRDNKNRKSKKTSSTSGQSQENEQAQQTQQQSVFDKLSGYFGFDDEEEMDEEEEQQLVDDWYEFVSSPDDLLGQVASEEAQKMQFNSVFGGLSIPGLEGKLGMKAISKLAETGMEKSDVDPALREAVQRNLQGQYDAEAGFGGTIADIAQKVSGFAGPMGNIVGLGAGAYKASQVPGALGRFSEQMGVEASLPDPVNTPDVLKDSGRDRYTQTTSPRPLMPTVGYNPFAAAGLELPDLEALLASQDMNSLF